MHVSRYISEYDIGKDDSLLVNALTGAVDIAGKNVLPSLRAGSSALPRDTLDLLQKRGYLLGSAEEEQRMLDDIGARARALRTRSRPREYIICPTYNCNLACTYCFESSVERSPVVMDDETIDAVFAAIDTLAAEEDRDSVLQLFGGEPLLPATRHAVSRILEAGRQRGLKTSIVTNGVDVLLFSDIIEDYADWIVSFQITVDGPRRVHDSRRCFAGRHGGGTFDRIMASIRHLIAQEHNVVLRVNVDRHNIAHLPALGRMLSDAAWANSGHLRCGVAPVQNHTGDTTYPHYMPEDEVVTRLTTMFDANPGLADILAFDHYRLLNRVTKALDIGGKNYAGPNFHYCESCMLDYYVFGVDGCIYACPEAIAQPRYAIGQFAPQLRFDEEKRAQWADRSALKIDKCRECEIISFCAGGCAYAALYANGNLYDPVCGDAKNVLARYIEHAVPRRLAGKTT